MGLCSSNDYVLNTDVKIANTVPSWLGTTAPRDFKEESFKNLKPLGKGKFGAVFLSQHIVSGTYYAIKYIAKDIINETKSIDKIQMELDTMAKLDCPFIIKYFGGFNTHACLSLVLELCIGGELYTVMKQKMKMEENVSLFYAIEIALALDYLHDKLQVVYRDLKPENILIDCNGHVKLCDMGFAVPLKKNSEFNEFLKDNCGTAMYVAPEIVGGGRNSRHGFPVDWWSYGCVVYEMVVGTAPFGDSEKMNKFEIFNNINSGKVRYPNHLSSEVKSFIKSFLELDTNNRGDYNSVVTSRWVSGIDLNQVYQLNIRPPWVPKMNDSKSPSTEHFVDWYDLRVPNKVENEAVNYCRSIKIPPSGRHTSSSSSSSSHGSRSSSISVLPPVSSPHSTLSKRVSGLRKSPIIDSGGSDEDIGTIGSGSGKGSGKGSPNRKRSNSKGPNSSSSPLQSGRKSSHKKREK